MNEQKNNIKNSSVVTSTKWDRRSEREALTFHLSLQCAFFWLLYYFYCRAKQRTKKSTRKEEKLQASPPAQHRNRSRRARGWAADGQPSRGASGMGKTVESTAQGSSEKRGTYCNMKTFIRDD